MMEADDMIIVRYADGKPASFIPGRYFF